MTEHAIWGGLACAVLPPSGAAELAVILCHGFGAPGDDLVSLGGYFQELSPELRQRAAFVFPAAPLDLTPRGLPGGRAWWWIDLNRLLMDPQPAKFAAFRRGLPPELPAARTALGDVVRQTEQRFQLDRGRIVLGGFSQGAMMAVDQALHLSPPPGGLVLFSGSCTNEAEWRERQTAVADLPVWQSHGQYDPILPLTEGERLKRFLQDGGAQHEWLEFRGQHEIPPSALQGAASFLVQRLNT